jgi:hypothetical protein
MLSDIPNNMNLQLPKGTKMNDTTLSYVKVGNFWHIDGTEIFLHVPFLKNSSDNYLKRIFRSDFGLEINEEIIQNLRSPSKQKTIKINKES